MGKIVSLPEVFTDPDQVIDCLLKGDQLSFTPGFIKKHSAISLQCAKEARKRYDKIGGDCSCGFPNVFVELIKEKIPSYAEDPAQLLALQYTGYNQIEWVIDEETGIPKLDEKGKKIQKNRVMHWSMGHELNIPEVYYRLVTEKGKLFAKMPKSIELIHDRITAEKNEDRFYTFHSITNKEFEIFAGSLKEIKDGKHGKNISLK